MTLGLFLAISFFLIAPTAVALALVCAGLGILDALAEALSD